MSAEFLDEPVEQKKEDGAKLRDEASKTQSSAPQDKPKGLGAGFGGPSARIFSMDETIDLLTNGRVVNIETKGKAKAASPNTEVKVSGDGFGITNVFAEDKKGASKVPGPQKSETKPESKGLGAGFGGPGARFLSIEEAIKLEEGVEASKEAKKPLQTEKKTESPKQKHPK